MTHAASSASSSPDFLDAMRRHAEHEEVALRAYKIWEQEGRADGYDQRHWFEAEHQLKALAAAQAETPAGAAAPEGNPAYPSLAERETITAYHEAHPEPTAPRPVTERSRGPAEKTGRSAGAGSAASDPAS